MCRAEIVFGFAIFLVVALALVLIGAFGHYGILGLCMGLIVHALHSLQKARVATGDASGINPVTYFTKYWVETLMALAVSIAIYLAIPALVDTFSEYTKIIGITRSTMHGYLPGFMCGMFGDQIADFLGGRVKKLYSDR